MHISRLLLLLISIAIVSSAYAFEPFVIKDIRVEGVQRTEPGTVFNYLPVKVGDTMTEEKATQAIGALYETGFFKNVVISAEGNTLIITLEERPSIGDISFDGIKAFKTEELSKAMKEVGLAQGRIFDRSLLDKAEQELKRQYVSNGMYSTTLSTTVTSIENNRVNIKFNVVEGSSARIRKINIVGNKLFLEKELLKQFTLRTPGFLTWYTKEDQYSKQKLSADLEKLRSYYLDRGYLEFNIDSTQVSITPDKRSVYITIGVSEGPQYKISEIKLGGELLMSENQARKLIIQHSGDVFSRARLDESSKAITDWLGNDGYAFANVNAVPELNREKHLVSFTFFVDPGKRVYIRRINISGNTKTRDEVIRREFRQAEGGWYSTGKIEKSKQRITRLGYFEDVNVETKPVPGTADQIDVNLSVKEKQTGAITVGAGFSTSDKLILSAGISQQNVFGTGNQVGLQVNTSHVNTIYSLSFVNPYWTEDGISRSYSIYKKLTDPNGLNLGNYRTDAVGGRVGWGIPFSENSAGAIGFGYDSTTITTYAGNVCCDPVSGLPVYEQLSPPKVIEYVDEFGNTTTTLSNTLGWSRNTIDNPLWPTRGTLQNVTTDIAIPGGSARYYILNYRLEDYLSITQNYVYHFNGTIGYGHGYDDLPFPFLKNFYAGGPGTLRGFQPSTVGPHDILNEPLGGSHSLLITNEVLFPAAVVAPILPDDKSVRLGAFIDMGTVGENYALGDIRMSFGISGLWISPFGPMKISIAKPFRVQPTDETQVLQFTFGQQF